MDPPMLNPPEGLGTGAAVGVSTIGSGFGGATRAVDGVGGAVVGNSAGVVLVRSGQLPSEVIVQS